MQIFFQVSLNGRWKQFSTKLIFWQYSAGEYGMSRKSNTKQDLRRKKSKDKRTKTDGQSDAVSPVPADKADAKPRGKIALWKKLAFTLVVNIVILGGAELFCRVTGLGAQQEVAYYIADWSKSWDSDFYVMSSTQGEHKADINRDGLRDRDHQIENTTGATRIVCLGDSVTFGYMVKPEESYPAILQRMLDERNQNCEVFNMALPGWSTRQERYAYERIARQYKPDFVILGVCLNDIPELRNNLAKPPAWIALPYRYSAVVRALLRPQAGEIHGVEELFVFHDEQRIKDAWNRFFEEVRLLNQQVTGDGAKLIVILFPFRVQVMPDAPAPIPQQTMAQVIMEETPYLDMLPTLRPLGWDGFIDYDHLTPLGATAVAESIIESRVLQTVNKEGKPGKSPPAND